jgi:acyl-CoA thioester hydrolase
MTEDPYPFFTTLRVRFNETDLQGHVNFAWYLNYFDVAQVAFLRQAGYSYQQMLADGLDLFYVDSHVTYRSPAYFDERLTVHCRLGRVGNSSLRFDFQIFAEADKRLVATGEITAVTADRESKSKIPVPERLRRMQTADVPPDGDPVKE